MIGQINFTGNAGSVKDLTGRQVKPDTEHVEELYDQLILNGMMLPDGSIPQFKVIADHHPTNLDEINGQERMVDVGVGKRNTAVIHCSPDALDLVG